jgi:hypothetical protein
MGSWSHCYIMTPVNKSNPLHQSRCYLVLKQLLAISMKLLLFAVMSYPVPAGLEINTMECCGESYTTVHLAQNNTY